MEVKLETRHFKGADRFFARFECPLYLSLKEMFGGDKELWLEWTSAEIKGERYHIQGAVYMETAYAGLSENDVDALIAKAKAGEEIETVIVNLIPVE